MKKAMKGIFKTIFYFVVCLIFTVYEPIKYVFTGSKIIGRLAIAGAYAGIVFLAISKPVAFFTILGIVAGIELLIAILMSKNPTSQSRDNHTNDYNRSEHNSDYNNRNNRTYENTTRNAKNPFFEGMTIENAKKEYHRLMKQYHPDNRGGSLEISQKVSAAYSQYCSEHSR